MSLEATVLAFLIALPGVEPVHSKEIANAVSEAAGGDHLLAAELITVGFFESGFTPRIQAGKCRKDECDFGRARSWFQVQRTSFSRDSWETIVGLERTQILAASRVAASILLAGRKACKTIEGTLSWYACGRCRWSGVTYRARMVRRLMAVVQ